MIDRPTACSTTSKKTLWATADKLRANLDAAEYKHLVLGLIDRLAATVAAWPGEPALLPCPLGEGRGEGSSPPCQDIPGSCRSVKLAEIAQHGHVLTPGRYMGAEEVEDNEADFTTKMQLLPKNWACRWPKGRSWTS